MVIIGNFQLKVFQNLAYARSWHVCRLLLIQMRKTFALYHELYLSVVSVCFIFSLLQAQTGAVKVCSETTGHKNDTFVRQETKNKHHHRFGWFTLGCECGEEMIQAFWAAGSVMTTKLLGSIDCNVLESLA